MLASAARGAARRRAAPEVGGQRWIVRNARSLRGRAQSALGRHAECRRGGGAGGGGGTAAAGRRANHAQSVAVAHDMPPEELLFSSLGLDRLMPDETDDAARRMLSFEASEKLAEIARAADARAPATVCPRAEREAFNGLYESLARDVEADVAALGLPAHSREWIAHMFDYTTRGGKMTRGLMVPQIVQAIGPVTEASLHQARVVGWCIEVLQAAFLVVDDVLDQAEMRRGQAAYYRLPQVGMKAVNDGLLLESIVFRLLRRHLRDHPGYLELAELFRETIFVTECGQLMDLTAPPSSVEELEARFTPEEYGKMVQCKTSHYTFYLPVACGMHLAAAATPAALDEARSVCDAIGEYFQVQDDYLDCFGRAELTGKGSTDIAERKCSWLAVTALDLARSSPEPAALRNLQQGLVDGDTAAVKAMYEELGVREAYEAYEESSVASIRHALGGEGVAALAPARTVLEPLLDKLYKRSK